MYGRDAITRSADFVWQDAEKVTLLTRPTPARRDAPFPMRRSRIVQTLNVPQRVRLGPSLAAALLDGLFEHPAGVGSCCAARLSSSQAHVRTLEVLACQHSF